MRAKIGAQALGPLVSCILSLVSYKLPRIRIHFLNLAEYRSMIFDCSNSENSSGSICPVEAISRMISSAVSGVLAVL